MGTSCLVIPIRKTGGLPGAGFDSYLDTLVDQGRQDFENESDPPLSGKDFSGNADIHEQYSICLSWYFFNCVSIRFSTASTPLYRFSPTQEAVRV